MAASQVSSMKTPHRVNLFSSRGKPLLSNQSSKVRVILRVRPFLPHEIQGKNGNPVSCISVVDRNSASGEEVTVHLKDQETSRSECYRLDSFFDQEDNNVSQIFYREVSPLIPVIFRGCNATIFAYGATGSGKTFTMQGSDELPGLMPLAMFTVLSMCQATGSTAGISFYEVYMDKCYDLLDIKPKEIAVLENKDGELHLRGLSRVPVKSMSEFYDIFSCGVQKRKVAQTALNDLSSRSHGVLVISVSSPNEGTHGKLNLIDLAGNEDNRRTCNEGIRLQESAKINQSLFALSNVIYALNNNQLRVPYRESKLTRILQDSLGGTSHALMVSCLNPGKYQESVHTVSLAARSRHISNFTSAQKQETPKARINMEVKLRAWLESKGKTKSAQRIVGLSSPLRTPCCTSSLKKASISITKNTAKAKEAGVRASNSKGYRPVHPENLLTGAGLVDSIMEDVCFHIPDASQANSEAAKDNCSPTIGRDNERSRSSSDEPLTNKEDTDKEGGLKSIQSPASTINLVHNSPRKALSPINPNANIRHLENLLMLSETKTPKTPYVTMDENTNHTFATPLDKFSARSSNLKSSLMQEYISFLNTASREELMEIKGIGRKRADYILELREKSPLNSLHDLEKMGLSSKQVYNMFNGAARVIFD